MTLPKVSIVVSTWLPENKPYLDLCIKSIRALDYPQLLLDVVVVGKPGYLPNYPGVLTVSPDKAKFYATEGMNYGVTHTDPKSEYLFLLNDDICLTRDCLKNLVAANQRHPKSVMSPISNSDANLQHDLDMGGAVYSACIRLEDVEKPDEMIEARSIYPAGVVYFNHICMASILIPRAIWNQIGPWDEGFHGGPDDIDYSYRLREADIRLAMSLDALAWHFGSVTISKTVSPATWCHNIEYFKEKWGHYPTYVNRDLHERVSGLKESGRLPEALTKDFV
jgi:GT2 family glycosyltransferase